MPSYCSSKIVFYSDDKTSLQDILDNINRCLEKPMYNSVKNYLSFSGMGNSSVIDKVDNRDCFAYCDKEISKKDEGGYYFQFSTDSTWVPNIEIFAAVIKEKYNGVIEILFQSEEPDNGIYITNDDEGEFFPERYKLNLSFDGKCINEYYSSIFDLQNALEKMFPKVCFDRTVRPEKIEAKIKEAYKFSSELNDYISINKFSYYNYTGGIEVWEQQRLYARMARRLK